MELTPHMHEHGQLPPEISEKLTPDLQQFDDKGGYILHGSRDDGWWHSIGHVMGHEQ
jgi:hypothetical protein